ncbi:MAG: helix-turn-helix domain-containing protein [Tannerellaceae bacterium]|jgi:hypothetical protein|nr:helix-turn-helix domain-containing protein [Tannerellaceae bacterium]
MFVSKEDFECWMRRILERIERLEKKLTGKEKPRHRVNGELLLDNQDLCIMLSCSKRTLQRYRSSGILPFRRIDQKTYYLESDVQRFIQEHLK